MQQTIKNKHSPRRFPHRGYFFCGICTENRGISEESIPRSGRTEGRSCGRFRSFSLVIRSFFRSFQVIPGHFPIDSGKSFLFIPFRSSFLPKTTENSPKSQSLEEKYDYFLKFPRFYLAVPDFLLTFATVYKMIVIYPAGRPFRLWLRSRRLFLCPKVSFSRCREKGVPIWRLHEP